MQVLFVSSISAMYVYMYEVFINFYIFFSETVMIVCIPATLVVYLTS